MIRWWHREVRGHIQYKGHVSVPAFDLSAQGLLIRCSCGKTWAK